MSGALLVREASSKKHHIDAEDVLDLDHQSGLPFEPANSLRYDRFQRIDKTVG